VILILSMHISFANARNRRNLLTVRVSPEKPNEKTLNPINLHLYRAPSCASLRMSYSRSSRPSESIYTERYHMFATHWHTPCLPNLIQSQEVPVTRRRRHRTQPTNLPHCLRLSSPNGYSSGSYLTSPCFSIPAPVCCRTRRPSRQQQYCV